MSKSVFDGIKVDDKAFPLSDRPVVANVPLSVVGHCPACNSPIYGPLTASSSKPIQVRRTCDCQPRRGSLQEDMKTT